ncbi:MAG: nitrilase-related carbon-nitrogen hydrolase [Bacillota bacterium]
MRFKIGLAQLRLSPDPKKNLAAAGEAAKTAGVSGVSLLVFPEMFLQGLDMEALAGTAEPPEGPLVRAMGDLAVKEGINLVFGFAERGAGGKMYNSAAVVERSTGKAHVYRKVHLFGKEGLYVEPGGDYPVFDLDVGRVGVLICFDSEFPEVARTLALKGAQILICPTANMVPFEPYQEVYMRARAMENHVHTAVCNTVGASGEYKFFGRSGVRDPLGRTILDLGYEECVGFAWVDLAANEASRDGLDYLAKRRPETYGALVEKNPGR